MTDLEIACLLIILERPLRRAKNCPSEYVNRSRMDDLEARFRELFGSEFVDRARGRYLEILKEQSNQRSKKCESL